MDRIIRIVQAYINLKMDTLFSRKMLPFLQFSMNMYVFLVPILVQDFFLELTNVQV